MAHKTSLIPWCSPINFPVPLCGTQHYWFIYVIPPPVWYLHLVWTIMYPGVEWCLTLVSHGNPFPFATDWSTSGCVIQSWSVKYNEKSNGGLGKDFSPCQKVGEVPQSSALTPAPWFLIWMVCCENVMMPGAVVAILRPWRKTTYALRQTGRAKGAWALNDADLTNPPWDQSTFWFIYRIQMIISINHWH